MSDVDLRSPIFADHPADWRSPRDVFNGFTLAWALELRERHRLSPLHPFDVEVTERLPLQFRYDTLAHLIAVRPGITAAELSRHSLVRLTTLSAAWQLFNVLDQSWQLRPNQFEKFAKVMAFVTGGRERPSVYQSLSATYGKCLLAVRVRRTFQNVNELDLAEEWFVTGDSELTFQDQRGNDSLLFHFGPQPIPVGIFAHEFVETVWSSARVIVDEFGPEQVIETHRHRVDELTELLTRGGKAAQVDEAIMTPAEFSYRAGWPGWS